MSTPRPRHLARARRPWRLLLVAFGFTTAVLAALVASATLLPQPEPPRRAPGVALPTVTTEPARTSTSFTTTTQEPATAPSPPTSSPETTPSAASRPITTAGRRTTSDAPLPSDTTQPPVATPSTAPEPTTTSTDPTTTTTSIEPTTTQSATTTISPVVLGGSQPAGVSAATVGGLVPLLGLLYLLRGLLPRPGGTHAKRRPTNRAHRD